MRLFPYRRISGRRKQTMPRMGIAWQWQALGTCSPVSSRWRHDKNPTKCGTLSKPTEGLCYPSAHPTKFS